MIAPPTTDAIDEIIDSSGGFPTMPESDLFELLDRGMDINHADKRYRNTLQCYAVSARSTEKLIKTGIDVNHRNNDGQTPLMHHAANIEIAKLLADAGADIGAADNLRNNALFDYFMMTEC